jgi:hypothetical protein
MTSSYEANFSSVRPLFSALEGGMLAVFRGVAYNVSFSPVEHLSRVSWGCDRGRGQRRRLG